MWSMMQYNTAKPIFAKITECGLALQNNHAVGKDELDHIVGGAIATQLRTIAEAWHSEE